MGDNSDTVARTRDESVAIYPFPVGTTPLVPVGERVVVGDVLARGHGVPTLVAYAATLGLSAAEAAAEIERHEGKMYRAGTPLATRRTGLRTRSVSPPISGSLRTLMNSGALAISDEANIEYRVRHNGVVSAVTERAIFLTVEVARCPYVFMDGTPQNATLHIAPPLLSETLTGGTTLPLTEKKTVTAVAHIADAAALDAIRSHTHGTLLVGSVSEGVAWQLLSRSHAKGREVAKQSAVVVLYGIGDLETGIATVAIFADLDGAAVQFEWVSRTVVAIPPVGTETSDN